MVENYGLGQLRRSTRNCACRCSGSSGNGASRGGVGARHGARDFHVAGAATPVDRDRCLQVSADALRQTKLLVGQLQGGTLTLFEGDATPGK